MIQALKVIKAKRKHLNSWRLVHRAIWVRMRRTTCCCKAWWWKFKIKKSIWSSKISFHLNRWSRMEIQQIKNYSLWPTLSPISINAVILKPSVMLRAIYRSKAFLGLKQLDKICQQVPNMISWRHKQAHHIKHSILLTNLNLHLFLSTTSINQTIRDSKNNLTNFRPKSKTEGQVRTPAQKTRMSRKEQGRLKLINSITHKMCWEISHTREVELGARKELLMN